MNPDTDQSKLSQRNVLHSAVIYVRAAQRAAGLLARRRVHQMNSLGLHGKIQCAREAAQTHAGHSKHTVSVLGRPSLLLCWKLIFKKIN